MLHLRAQIDRAGQKTAGKRQKIKLWHGFENQDVLLPGVCACRNLAGARNAGRCYRPDLQLRTLHQLLLVFGHRLFTLPDRGGAGCLTRKGVKGLSIQT